MIERFAIHALPAPGGGAIGICRLPGRSGDLPGDLAIIAGWRPEIVVSMTDMGELCRFGAATLAADLAAFGIRHAHFPIADFGTPDLEDERWPGLAGRLHAILDSGGKILLHCMGGQGRSGMIAVRLMAERGLAGADALLAIRSIRPGAVETEAQAEWGQAGDAQTR